MKIRIIALGTDDMRQTEQLHSELGFIFSEYLTDNGAIEFFPSMKDATVSIAKAFSDSHIIMFLASPGQYGVTKELLAKALGFSYEVREDLLSIAEAATGEEIPGDSELAVMHAGVPAGAKAFVMTDGLYAGFSAVKGRQTIFLLPFEKERTEGLLSMQVIPYINAFYKSDLNPDAVKRYKAQKLFSAAAGHDATFAVAGTRTAEFFEALSSYAFGLEDIVTICPRAEARGNLPPVDYVVNISIAASELIGAPYGVAISNAFYMGDSADSEKIVYMAVTDEDESTVREIHSIYGEGVTDFLSRCCEDLFEFLTDIINANADMKAMPDKKKTDKHHKGISVLLIVLIIIFVLGIAAIGINHHHPFAALIDKYFPGSDDTLTTQMAETTVKSAEKTTSAPVYTTVPETEITTEKETQTETEKVTDITEKNREDTTEKAEEEVTTSAQSVLGSEEE